MKILLHWPSTFLRFYAKLDVPSRKCFSHWLKFYNAGRRGSETSRRKWKYFLQHNMFCSAFSEGMHYCNIRTILWRKNKNVHGLDSSKLTSTLSYIVKIQLKFWIKTMMSAEQLIWVWECVGRHKKVKNGVLSLSLGKKISFFLCNRPWSDLLIVLDFITFIKEI